MTAFNIKVPTMIKRTLTTLQITQFLIGAAYAMLHSFVYYTVPVQVPVYRSAASVVSAAAQATAAVKAASFLDGLKMAVFGAAEAAAPAAIVSASESAQTDSIIYETQYQATPCTTTIGQTFAIWLNVLYLAPLTYLFASFFVQSYLKRNNAETERARTEKKTISVDRRLSNAMVNAEKAGWDAARDLEKEVYGQGSENAIVEEEMAVEEERAIVEEEAVLVNSRLLRSRPNGAKPIGKKA